MLVVRLPNPLPALKSRSTLEWVGEPDLSTMLASACKKDEGARLYVDHTGGGTGIDDQVSGGD